VTRMKLVTEFLLDQCLLYGVSWEFVAKLYFVKFDRHPYRTFVLSVLLFLVMLLSYLCTLGAINLKRFLVPEYKNYQLYFLLVAKFKEGSLDVEAVKEACNKDSLDYYFIKSWLTY
jgi:hypothetical protein